ncbi:MAG: MerR family transcriptional regulator [Chitinophagaceae bacterium]
MQQLNLFELTKQKQPIEKIDEKNNVLKFVENEAETETINIAEEIFLVKKENGKAGAAPITQKKISSANEIIEKKRGRKSFKETDAEVDLIKVPEDEILFQKQYYSISIVAEWFNVNNSLLRFWENEFKILKPRKNKKGDRLFRPEDVKNLKLIYYLLRQRKFSIEGAKKYLEENKTNADTNFQLIQSLTKFRNFLLEMKANLEE